MSKNRLIIVFFACLIGLGIILDNLRYITALDTVKSSFSDRLVQLTGLKVTQHDDPIVTTLPIFSLHLKQVTIGDEKHDLPPVATIERLECSFSFLAVILGDFDISLCTFKRPKIVFAINKEGQSNWESSNHSKIRELFAEVKKTSPDWQKFSWLKSFEFLGGEIQFIDERYNIDQHFTDVNFTANLSDPLSPVDFTGKAIWQGEQIAWNANVENLGDGLSEKGSAFTVGLISKPLLLDFSGEIALANEKIIAGQFSSELTSLNRVKDWVDLDLKALSNIRDIKLSGHVEGQQQQILFSNMSVQSGENVLEGHFKIDRLSTTPVISGNGNIENLVFEDDLNPDMILALTDILLHDYNNTLSQWQMDLRLAIQSIDLDNISFSNATFSLLNEKEDSLRLASQFILKDASFSLQALMNKQQNAESSQLEVSLRSEDFDIRNLPDRFSIPFLESGILHEVKATIREKQTEKIPSYSLHIIATNGQTSLFDQDNISEVLESLDKSEGVELTSNPVYTRFEQNLEMRSNQTSYWKGSAQMEHLRLKIDLNKEILSDSWVGEAHLYQVDNQNHSLDDNLQETGQEAKPLVMHIEGELDKLNARMQ